MSKLKNLALRLLDPELGARVRAVVRAVGVLCTIGALAAKADEIAAVITAAQGVLAVLVLTPTAKPKGN